MEATINVDSIISDVQQKIEKERLSNRNVISFIASELSKIDSENIDEILNTLINDIDMKYLTKSQITIQLKDKIQEIKNSQPSDASLVLEQTKAQTNVEPYIFSGDSSRSYFNLKQLIARLEKNRDLTGLSDPVLHFGKRHFNLAKRIFFLQATQNYLSAIKYLTIKDLISKQTLFNIATEDAIKNVINLINDLQRGVDISITELKNYQHDSENWIRNGESKINEIKSKFLDYELMITTLEKNHLDLDSKITNFQSNITSSLNKAQNFSNDKQRELEIKINENYNELKELIITRDLKTTEFLLERISNLESQIKEIKEKSA